MNGSSRIPMIFQVRNQMCTCKAVIIVDKDPVVSERVNQSIKSYHPVIEIAKFSLFSELQ
jgi:hypothetical protein